MSDQYKSKQVEERDPQKMMENLKNTVGIRPTVPVEEVSQTPEEYAAAMQAANLARAQQDPEMAARLKAINALRERAIAEQMQSLAPVVERQPAAVPVVNQLPKKKKPEVYPALEE
jgi:adenylyl- and sulfurtransferase ThiI